MARFIKKFGREAIVIVGSLFVMIYQHELDKTSDFGSWLWGALLLILLSRIGSWAGKGR